MKSFGLRYLVLKLILFVLLAEGISLVTMDALYVMRMFRGVRETTENRISLPGRLIAAGMLMPEAISDAATLERLVGRTPVAGFVADSDGLIVHSLDPRLRGRRVEEAVTMPEDGPVEPGSPLILLTRTHAEAWVSVQSPGTAGSLIYLRVTNSGPQLQKTAMIFFLVGGSLLTMLLTTAFIVLAMRRVVLSRLYDSLRVLGQVQGGDLSARIAVALETDEIGALQRGINSTIDQLQIGIQDLQREVGDRQKAEGTLLRTQAAFLRLLDSIDATIYVADFHTYEVLFVNRVMEDAFPGPLTGLSCYHVFRGAANPCEFCSNPRLLDADGRPREGVVWEGRNPINGRYYLNFDRALYWVDGRLARVQIGTDITRMKNLEAEKRRVEEQFFQAQKLDALGTLAGGIAHDFNNLMMGIQGNISLALLDTGREDPNWERLRNAETLIKSATGLTRQLLGLARGGKYQVKVTDLAQLVARTTDMFARTRKEIRVEVEQDSILPPAKVDRGQIEQVLLNILLNAWQASSGGGEIRVVTRTTQISGDLATALDTPEGDYLQVSVADTGVGMDRSILERAFDPFFTTREKERGTGLGLASAWGIIKNHGGTIWAESEPGLGSTFHIYLPTAADEEISLPEEPTVVTHTPAVGRETVLLVDDERMILDVGQKMLRALGYSVLTANSGVEAISLFCARSQEIALVILDIVMPDMGGSELFDQLKRKRKGIKTLISSGYSVAGEATRMLDKGSDGFIQKPFTLQQLSDKIREILDPPG